MRLSGLIPEIHPKSIEQREQAVRLRSRGRLVRQRAHRWPTVSISSSITSGFTWSVGVCSPRMDVSGCAPKRGPYSERNGVCSSNRLIGGAGRHTLSYMKTSALTIRLDPELEEQLDRVAKRSGRSRSEVVREALRRQLAVAQFDDLRKRIMPFAEARGYLTDEDVFRDVS